MEETGSNLADNFGEMGSSNPPNAPEELRKRRSTRIVQAVPLGVTGVDALGRPFQERTSTLIINCHGCRYQSKHYVLKNMWVTLEIPHPEAVQPPRTVRGRVAWIQRPRTVRQLFQVALELEAPGNVWGIGFPPEDWAGITEGAAGEGVPLAELPVAVSGQENPEHLDAQTPAEAVAEPPDNVRIFPAPAGTDASLQLARLLADAKQQIQVAAQEAARQAVNQQTAESLKAWKMQFASAQEEFLAEASRAIKKLEKEAAERAQASQQSVAETLEKDLHARLAPQFDLLAQNFTEQLNQFSAERKSQLEQHAQTATEGVLEAKRHAEEWTEWLRNSVSQTEILVAARLEAASRNLEDAARRQEEAANQHRATVLQAAQELKEKLNESLEGAEAAWRERLANSLEQGQLQIRQSVDQSLQGAPERAARSVEEGAMRAHAGLEEAAAHHADALSEMAGKLAAEREERTAALRAEAEASARRVGELLSSARISAEKLEEFSAGLEGMLRDALGEFRGEVERLLAQQRQEMQRRSEALLEDTGHRVRAAIEESSRESAQRFEAEVGSLVQPHIASAEEAVHRLAGGRSLLDAAMTLQEDRVRSMTDEAFEQAQARFGENLGTIEQEMHAVARSILEKTLADLDARSSELKHSTVESLYKSAEWYEKKAQTQILQLTERGVEQGGQQLRERAGEISSVFATELDHMSRNFVSHAQSQMEEVVREAFERSRALFTEASETTSAAFTDEIQRQARGELDGFGELLQKTTEESREQLGAQITAEQEAFLPRFHASMNAALEAGVAEAQGQVHSGLQQVVESWSAMAAEHQEELRRMCGQLGDQSVEQFRGRLENVSNSWMVAAVTTLDHQSRDVLTGVARAAEEKLRATCEEVFADVGETLKDRLREIAASFARPGTARPPA